jgi:gluconate 2-dehydrogenase gamma chain
MTTSAGPAEPAGFFDEHQRATVEAAMARIIPTDDTPGAREAGAVDFVDRYLSGIGYIYALPDGSGFEQLTGRRADAWQQRVDLARSKYVAGIAALDRLSQEHHGCDFVDLDGERQDEVLRVMERSGGEAGGQAGRDTPAIAYGGPVEPALQQTNAESDLDFFGLLVTHTRQGFLADPIYGGNRDRVGWQVIGFPGPAHLAEVHTGRYSTLEYFADDRTHRVQEGSADA